MDQIALQRGGTIDLQHPWTGNAALGQLTGVVGEALGVGKQRCRSQQSLATKELEIAAIGKAQDLVAVMIGFHYLGGVAQFEIARMFERLHAGPVNVRACMLPEGGKL